jgi:PAS domain S-box-containing protein
MDSSAASQPNDFASARQAGLLELASDAIIVRDVQGTISYWNAGAEALYGWPRAEALGRTIQTLLRTVFPQPPEDILATVTTEGHWEGELTHTRRDGRNVTVASRWALERDSSGQPLAILQITTDITARKQAEAAMAHLLHQAETAEAQFRGLLEAAPDATVIASRDGRIVQVNRQTEVLFGYPRELLLGQPVELLVPDRFREGHVGRREQF